jgi:protocatechuate 3,4-dioxygenase beta subunit
MAPVTWLLRRVRWAGLVLIVAASLGAAVGMLAGGPAFAAGETGGSPTEPGTSPTGTGTSNCPSSNPPNEMTLVAGTPQTAILGSAFASGLQVALSNSDGCPVTSAAAGVPVTFSAPASGASGVFSTSGTNTVTVGADSSGAIMAPTFTANGIAGNYTVTASSQYGSVSFALTNTAAGTPARLMTVSPVKQTATIAGRYRQALAVKVLDGNGNPVAGASVTFTLTASTDSSACGTSSSSSAGSAADASFTDGATQASATSNASGIATSPALTANGEAGTLTASAALGSSGGSEPHGGTSTSSVAPALFTLTNLAGKPAKIAPGVGSTQSTPAGSAFPIRLAVTVTDAQKNPVPGALVTFSAPAAGGRFTLRSHGSRHHRARVSYAHTVKVKTSACGIAVAPSFTASRQPGGYIVKASAKPARPAAFALVNEAP